MNEVFKDLTLEDLLKVLPDMVQAGSEAAKGPITFNVDLFPKEGGANPEHQFSIHVEGGKVTIGDGHVEAGETVCHFQILKGGLETLLAMQVNGLPATQELMMKGAIGLPDLMKDLKLAPQYFEIFQIGEKPLLDALSPLDLSSLPAEETAENVDATDQTETPSADADATNQTDLQEADAGATSNLAIEEPPVDQPEAQDSDDNIQSADVAQNEGDGTTTAGDEVAQTETVKEDAGADGAEVQAEEAPTEGSETTAEPPADQPEAQPENVEATAEKAEEAPIEDNTENKEAAPAPAG